MSSRESIGRQVLERPMVAINLFSGKVIKGYLENVSNKDLEEQVRHSLGNILKVIKLKESDSNAIVEIALQEVKAVFFVKSFAGNPQKKQLRFYKHGPEVAEIWVEIKFKDSEILEGLIDNSVEHLTGPGFLLHPSDVSSNNLAIYVNKAAIAEYRVLGVRGHRSRSAETSATTGLS